MGRILTAMLALAGCASDVSTRQAHALVDGGARLLDVRSRAEFLERHPAAAVNIPVGELRRRVRELGPRDRPVVVYCHTGVRSGIAAHMLRRAGFSRVYNLGSIGRWFHEPADPPLPVD